MNKEQAIEQIKNIKEYIINPHQAEPQSMVFKQTQREKRLQALDIAIESLDNEWVSVNDEQKPKHRERVLVTDDDEVVFDCSYAEDLYEVGENDDGTNDFAQYKGRSGFYYYEKAIGSFLKVENIIAWKPLPKPYKRREQENNGK